MHSATLAAARHSDTPLFYVTHPAYLCCEYQTRMNLFTFGKLNLRVPITVVGLPISLDACGYCGDLAALIRDYRRRKGLVLLLNLPQSAALPPDVASGPTLGTCVFHNRFSCFEDYLSSLRATYRRRANQAMRRAAGLTLRPMAAREFTAQHHQLYLNVLRRSRYPLEQLEAEFFRQFDGELFAYEHQGRPVAFFLIQQRARCLHFIFGGMDYACRDEFDLYVNMLLDIVRIGTQRGCDSIDLGQTAEQTKLRLGAVYQPLYMAAFSGNSALNWLLRKFAPRLCYQETPPEFRVFRESDAP
jgi:hypothetical protein